MDGDIREYIVLFILQTHSMHTACRDDIVLK